MKKKKPKKSPGKSPPKGGSSAASPPPPLSDVVDLIIHSDLIVSDAQYGLPAGAVAQQSEDFVDLAANSVDVSSKQIVIVTPLSDPSSVNEISEIALESNSASPQSTSAADHEDPASTACKVASINHSESVTVESSLTSPKSSSTVIPVEQLIGDDKAVPPSPLPLSTAEVIEGPNSLLALAVTEFPRLPAKENSEEGAKAAVRQEGQGKKTRRSRSKGIRTDAVLPKDQEEPRSQKPLTAGGELRWIPKDSPASHAITSGSLQVEVAVNSKLGTDTDRVFGETSGSASLARKELQRSNSRSDQSDVQPDSSDVESSDSELEEADALQDSTWVLPHPRSQQEVDLHSYLTTISLPLSPDIDDSYEWIAGDSPLRER
ncbi:hypothetical protein IGI04_033251 [Brassica rapa subsp. trilocularis]|uniref:Uncharacterized protein n=1 Tax=Brassica rapa subsp. trilocularis TaxID=1813537 RepID=A0ABQ7L5B4_BRACM|nr:hypothetical protein IGI04_033251 [Brassica rapa subsp. trilocularis]